MAANAESGAARKNRLNRPKENLQPDANWRPPIDPGGRVCRTRLSYGRLVARQYPLASFGRRRGSRAWQSPDSENPISAKLAEKPVAISCPNCGYLCGQFRFYSVAGVAFSKPSHRYAETRRDSGTRGRAREDAPPSCPQRTGNLIAGGHSSSCPATACQPMVG